MDSINFTILPPPEILKNDVECFRVATYSGQEEPDVLVCPNGFPGLLFQHREGESAIKNIVTRSGRVAYIPTLFVNGQITELAAMRFKTPFTTIQVVLKPYALKTLFGLDASKLTNGSMLPGDFGGETLNAKLLAASDTPQRLALLTEFLTGLLSQGHERDLLVEQSLDLIRQNIDNVSVKFLVEQLYISARQFERRFTQAVGITPQFFIRVRRVNEALRLMDSGQYERLSDVAYYLNFHDQSHFIRDIKAFSGVTPRGITQQVRDFHRDRVGASYLNI